MAADTLKKVLFRLDSGGIYGLGHAMRCRALADALSNNGIECTFAVKMIHANTAVMPHQLIFINNEDEFLEQAKCFDCVIIDHYDYTSELFLRLSKLKHLTLGVLDDECNRGCLYADLIINPLGQAQSLPYKQVSPKAKLLFGSDYILLRTEFSQLTPPDYKSRDSIVITFGGSDVNKLTFPVLKTLKNSSLSDAKIIAVTGAGYHDSHKIKDYCQQNAIVHQHDVKNMSEIFAKAKFAISAAGTSVFELASCGVPAVFAVVADNQLLSATEQSQNGWCTMIDCRRQNKEEQLVHQAEQMINSSELEHMSFIARSLIDGHGAERVAAHLIYRHRTKKEFS